MKGVISLVKQKKIPKATARRLPLYHRYFTHLYEIGTKRISSAQLSETMKIDSATIRRDFSYFGALGKRGYGYDVETLMNFFKDQLSQEKLTNIALVGTGNLGQALLNYNFRKDNNIRISAGFDIDDNIVCTIKEKAQIDTQLEISDRLVYDEIKVILNFSPLPLTVPKTLRVHNVDLTNELQAMVYFIDHYGQEEGQQDNNFDLDDE